MMKKAFTLVELLIVVVVIVTLMSIAFRINSAGEESKKVSDTINNIQRLENCLSGYYAAFGSYPPVKIHGSRDYRCSVNQYDIQQLNPSDRETSLNAESVKAACRSQPVAFEYPSATELTSAQKDLAEHELGNTVSQLQNPTDLLAKRNESEWSEVQVFRFGLLSYLLPRLLIAIPSDKENKSVGDTAIGFLSDFAQWTENNELPCRFEDGRPYASWSGVRDDLMNDKWKIAVLPSQAICARWMPNLENTLTAINGMTLYGVSVVKFSGERAFETAIHTYSAADSQSGKNASKSQEYFLFSIDCFDGWNEGLYYYSLPPYQTYRLWSSGPNKETFPPWVTNEELMELKESDRKLAQEWVKDDIVHLSH